MDYKDAINELKRMSNRNPKDIEKMYRRFGINVDNALGIPVPEQKLLAKKIGKDHKLAQQLWNSGFHEAKTVAAMIDDPKEVTEKQMEKWVKDFASWDTCDGCCAYLFDKTIFAYKKAEEWSKRKEEYVKRAGFAMISQLFSLATSNNKFI